MMSDNSTFLFDRQKINEFLIEAGCDTSVIEHCNAVANYALLLCKKINVKIDCNLVELGALFHDIGRSKTHGIRHGIEGSKIVMDLLDRLKGNGVIRISFNGREYPVEILKDVARICECHIGAGISKDEAIALGLPSAKDYIPKTLEEKVVAHADNLIRGTRPVGIEDTIMKFKKRLGDGHPAIKRVVELEEYIKKITRKYGTETSHSS